mmetsp:Transcript_117958/g.327947  ORF Transcript_117958/g.327947 Transcript_117958/m.327947 type:complete len:297 (-) Transcript_117958:25-915(-)
MGRSRAPRAMERSPGRLGPRCWIRWSGRIQTPQHKSFERRALTPSILSTSRGAARCSSPPWRATKRLAGCSSTGRTLPSRMRGTASAPRRCTWRRGTAIARFAGCCSCLRGSRRLAGSMRRTTTVRRPSTSPWSSATALPRRSWPAAADRRPTARSAVAERAWAPISTIVVHMPRQSVTQVAARAGCSAWIDIGPMHFMSRGCDHGASFSSEFVLVCMRWRNARGMRVVVVAAGIASNVSRRLAAQFGHRTSGFGESGMCISAQPRSACSHMGCDSSVLVGGMPEGATKRHQIGAR